MALSYHMRRGHSAGIKVQVLDCAAGSPTDHKKVAGNGKKMLGQKDGQEYGRWL
jgi:hypothetical protein